MHIVARPKSPILAANFRLSFGANFSMTFLPGETKTDALVISSSAASL